MLQTERYKTRMRFTKTGSVRFVGHLDLMRFFQKAIRRAGLNVAYSKGFSPHQLMGFAAPLGVGATTDGDYMDVEFEPVRPEAGRDPAQESAGADSGQARAIMPDSYDVPPEMLMERLNGCLTDEIFVTAIWRMPEGFKNSMSLLETSAYMITAKTPEAFPVDVSNRFEEFLSQDEILVVKKTKKSEREIDLKPALDEDTLEKRVQRDFEKYKNKQTKNRYKTNFVKAME